MPEEFLPNVKWGLIPKTEVFSEDDEVLLRNKNTGLASMLLMRGILSGMVRYYPLVTALTGADSLAALPTLGLTAGRVAAFKLNGRMQAYVLEFSNDAASSPEIIHPVDRGASPNNRLWRWLGQMHPAVVDSFASTSATAPASANRVKILNDALVTMGDDITSLQNLTALATTENNGLLAIEDFVKISGLSRGEDERTYSAGVWDSTAGLPVINCVDGVLSLSNINEIAGDTGSNTAFRSWMVDLIGEATSEASGLMSTEQATLVGGLRTGDGLTGGNALFDHATSSTGITFLEGVLGFQDAITSFSIGETVEPIFIAWIQSLGFLLEGEGPGEDYALLESPEFTGEPVRTAPYPRMHNLELTTTTFVNDRLTSAVPVGFSVTTEADDDLVSAGITVGKASTDVEIGTAETYLLGPYDQIGELGGKPAYFGVGPSNSGGTAYWDTDDSEWILEDVENNTRWIGTGADIEDVTDWAPVSPATGTVGGIRVFQETVRPGQMVEDTRTDSVALKRTSPGYHRIPKLDEEGYWPVSGVISRPVTLAEIATDVPAIGERIHLPDHSNCTAVGDGTSTVDDLVWHGHQYIEVMIATVGAEYSPHIRVNALSATIYINENISSVGTLGHLVIVSPVGSIVEVVNGTEQTESLAVFAELPSAISVDFYMNAANAGSYADVTEPIFYVYRTCTSAAALIAHSAGVSFASP